MSPIGAYNGAVYEQSREFPAGPSRGEEAHG